MVTDLMTAMALPSFMAMGAAMMTAVLVFALAIYVYSSWAWMVIAKKLKYKYPWLSWIPFANISMMLQMGKFHWAWVFLILIPFAGWLALGVLVIIAMWKIFEKRKYPGWLSLILVLMGLPTVSWIAGPAYLVIIGLVAWKDM